MRQDKTLPWDWYQNIAPIVTLSLLAAQEDVCSQMGLLVLTVQLH